MSFDLKIINGDFVLKNGDLDIITVQQKLIQDIIKHVVNFENREEILLKVTSNIWINGIAGIRKTVEEAQAIVTEQVQIAQAAWDALPADDFRKKQNARPNDIVLPE